MKPTDSAHPLRVWTLIGALALGVMDPFGWLVRCRSCWGARYRAVIGDHHGRWRLLWVCPVCRAIRPMPAWLQAGRRDDNINA